MPKVADRVRETTTTTGTGAVTLAGAVSGYRTFASAFSDGDSVYYAITDGTNWEVGYGQYNAGILNRSTVLSSSNSNTLVSFGAGSKDVFNTAPANAFNGIPVASGDQYWGNVTFLSHMDGANASTTFTDVKGHVMTRSGSAQISTAQSKFGGSSAVFNGTTDYVSIAYGTDLEFGNGDFTMEGWFYVNNVTGYKTIIAGQADFHYGVVVNSNKMNMFFSSNGTSWDMIAGDVTPFAGAGTITVTASAWHHWVVQRQGTTFTMYLDGVLDKQTTGVSGTVFSRNENINLGRWGNASYFMNGYMDEVRITKGVARYSGSTFAVPTNPFESSYYYISALGGTNLGSLTNTIAQTSHGFSVGNLVYFNGTNWLLAKADNPNTICDGMVSSVVDTNTFVLTTVGAVTSLSGLTPGAPYYLSDTTAGLATTTRPSLGVVQPIGIAASSTTLLFEAPEQSFPTDTSAYGLVLAMANRQFLPY